MALTRITKGVIKPNENYDTHNINSTGIVTAIGFKGPFTGSSNIQSGIITATKIDLNGDIDVDGHTNLDNVSIAGVVTATTINATTFSGAISGTTGTFSGNVSIGGTLTYEDVTNIDSVGIITARSTVSIGDSINHIGDTDTAIRFPSANTITAETSGSERLRIDADGRLLQNITAIGDYMHQMQGAGGTGKVPAILFKNGTASTNEIIGGWTAYNTTNQVASIYAKEQSANDDAYLQFSTKATGGSLSEKLRITSAGKVIIGNESTPGGLLHIKEGDSGLSAANVHADTVFIENSANAGITIATPNTNTGYLTFADPEDDNIGQIIYRHGGSNANSMGFFVNANERLRITSGGQVSISGAGTTFGNNTLLNIAPANRTTAFSASDGDTWHDVVIKQGASATTNSVGIAFEVSPSPYHKNAGTGIVAIKDGNNFDYGTHLSFVTRPHTAVAEERLRITSAGRVGIGLTNPSEDLEVKGDQTATIFINSGQHDASTAQEATLKLGWNQSHANDSIGYVKLIEGGGNAFDGDLTFGVPYNNSGTPATREVIRAKWNGKIGVGTISPDETLELFKASGTNLLKVSSQANSTIGIEIEKTGSTTQSWRIADGQTVNGALEFYDVTDSRRVMGIDGSGRVIIGSGNHAGGSALVVKGGGVNTYSTVGLFGEAATPSDDAIFAQIRFGSGGTKVGATINAKADADWGASNDYPTRLEFWTAPDGSGTVQERLRINSSGGVKIGSGSATGIHNLAKVLEISGGDGGDLIIGNDASANIGAGAHIGAIAFKNIDNSVGSAPHYAGIRCEATDTSGNMDLRFYTGITNLETDTPQVLINNIGNVGIGEDDPNTKLDIVATPLNTATLSTTNCKQLGLLLTPGGTGSNTEGHIYTGVAVGDGYAGLYGVDAGASAATHLAFFTGSASAVAERLRIDSGGRVGINKTPDTDGGLVQIRYNEGYQSGSTNLLTSASKAAFRIQTSSDSSKSLYFGGIDEHATPYLQVGNKGSGGATAVYSLVLQPFGGNVQIGGNGTQGGNEKGLLDIYHTSDNDINNPHIRLHGPSNNDARIEFGSATNVGEGGYISYNDADEGLYIGSRMSGYAEVHLCTGMNDGSPHSNTKLTVNTNGRSSHKNANNFDREAYTKGGTVHGGGAASGANSTNPGAHAFVNDTPVRGSQTRYSFWTQSGDAYPNASQYLDFDVANSSMYRVLVKGSNSSATADIAQFLIYGLANSSGNLAPVIEQLTTSPPSFNGDTGGSADFHKNSGSFSCKVMGYGTSGGTRGSLGTYGTTLRIEYSGANNQGLLAFIERWDTGT